MENMDIGKALRKLSNQIKRHFDVSNTIQLTGAQGRVLHFILARSEDNIDLFQKDVEKEFNLRRASATGILQLMEKNGLLYRENVNYDARLKKIILTNKAKQQRENVIKDIRDMEEKLVRNVTEEEKVFLYYLLIRMSENFEL